MVYITMSSEQESFTGSDERDTESKELRPQLPQFLIDRILSYAGTSSGAGVPPGRLGEQSAAATSAHIGIGRARLPDIDISRGICIVDNLMGSEFLQAARREAEAITDDKGREARMGGGYIEEEWTDRKFRGDRVSWLKADEVRSRGAVHLLQIMELLQNELQHQLVSKGEAVGGHVSFQLACYPGSASRYVRHRDKSASSQHRVWTILYYMNLQPWPQGNGGQLCIYNGPEAPGIAPGPSDAVAGVETATLIAPHGDRLVLFRSELEHEVLPCFAPRYSLIAWLSQEAGAQQLLQQERGSHPSNASQTAGPSSSGGTTNKEEVSSPRAGAELPGPSASVGSCGEATDGRALQRPPQHPSPATICHTMRQGIPTGTAPQEEPQGLTRTAAPDTSAHPSMTMAHHMAPHPSAAHQGRNLPGAAPAPPCTEADAQELVFVSIASYRDPDCCPTVHSLLSQASSPQRIRVGICWQLRGEEVQTLPADLPPQWLHHVRQVLLPSQEASGPCKARWLAAGLAAGEAYLLQIDSHMRFRHGWDADLIRWLRQAEQQSAHGKAVLSTYPPSFSIGPGPSGEEEGWEDTRPVLLCASHFGEEGMLRLRGRRLSAEAQEPIPSLFWAAGFSFSRLQLLDEVPYSPLPGLFFGEELHMLARMWTRGWDVFAPPSSPVLHCWSRSHRPTVFEDHPTDPAVKQASILKVLELLADAPPDPTSTAAPATVEASLEALRSRLGCVRSLAEMQAFCGVDFRSRRIAPRGLRGGMDGDGAFD